MTREKELEENISGLMALNEVLRGEIVDMRKQRLEEMTSNNEVLKGISKTLEEVTKKINTIMEERMSIRSVMLQMIKEFDINTKGNRRDMKARLMLKKAEAVMRVDE